jgi:hypothetical protein
MRTLDFFETQEQFDAMFANINIQKFFKFLYETNLKTEFLYKYIDTVIANLHTIGAGSDVLSILPLDEKLDNAIMYKLILCGGAISKDELFINIQNFEYPETVKRLLVSSILKGTFKFMIKPTNRNILDYKIFTLRDVHIAAFKGALVCETISNYVEDLINRYATDISLNIDDIVLDINYKSGRLWFATASNFDTIIKKLLSKFEIEQTIQYFKPLMFEDTFFINGRTLIIKETLQQTKDYYAIE